MLNLFLKAFKKKEQAPESIDTGISREDWIKLKVFTLIHYGWSYQGIYSKWWHPSSNASSGLSLGEAYHATVLCMEEALKAE